MSGRSAEQLLQVSLPALVPSDAEAVKQRPGASLLMLERREVNHNNALSSVGLQVEGPAMSHGLIAENALKALIT